MKLPDFKYHPDPLTTGSVVASVAVCECCEQARGCIYVGPVYSSDELDDAICPWCIADGSAHEKFGASFTDEAGIGGYGEWESVPDDVVKTLAYRTPGFSGWQQEQWWTHCGDACAFIGHVGHKELTAYGHDAIASIQLSTGLSDGAERSQFFEALEKDGSPTAYLFKCCKCGKLGGYQDCD